MLKHGARNGGAFPHEYNAWKDMRQRCLNPRHHKYPLYGGRGVKISKRWSSFAAFAQDMGKKPSPHHLYSLDRKNNNGNYHKRNCRWATRSQQNRNRRALPLCFSCHKPMPVGTLCDSMGRNHIECSDVTNVR